MCRSLGESFFLEFTLNDQLIAVALTDVFDNALSAVYTFFDPDYSKNSLGTYAVLQQVEFAKFLSKSYLYLGYYIKDSKKMSYKEKFQPLELYQDEKWACFSLSSE